MDLIRIILVFSVITLVLVSISILAAYIAYKIKHAAPGRHAPSPAKQSTHTKDTPLSRVSNSYDAASLPRRSSTAATTRHHRSEPADGTSRKNSPSRFIIVND